MEKVYIILWNDVDLEDKYGNSNSLFGISGVCETIDLARVKLEELFEIEKEKYVSGGLFDKELVEDNGEDYFYEKWDNGFKIQFNNEYEDVNYIEYEIKEQTVIKEKKEV